MTKAVDVLFVGKEPAVRATFDRLVAASSKFGPLTMDPNKSSIHLVHKTAFAGAHPRKAWLDVTIKSDKPLKGPRIRNQDQASKNRWHQDVRLVSPREVDAELIAWLKAAFVLAGERK